MSVKPTIQSAGLSNLLSFGPDGTDIDLKSLNVLIGPNASGKSNFVEALRLLSSLPSELPNAISRSGGIDSLLWKGPKKVADTELETIIYDSAVIGATLSDEEKSLTYNHMIALHEVDRRFEIRGEFITQAGSEVKDQELYIYNDLQHVVWGMAEKDEVVGDTNRLTRFRIPSDVFKRDRSILAQLSDPERYPALAYLTRMYKNIHIYSDLSVARGAPVRMPQPADLEADFLSPNAENLALVLSSLMNNPAVKQRILKELRRFVERASDIIVHVSYGTAQLYLEEEGLRANIPATRISDGTLRYLCLLAILCHPSPPPLICIEEPEVGLHPDMIRSVAELLVDASTRTQLVITTHSDLLVSALSDVPEAIIICERDENGTQLRRLDPDKLREWLERYTLGELWLKGEIGGTRW